MLSPAVIKVDKLLHSSKSLHYYVGKSLASYQAFGYEEDSCNLVPALAKCKPSPTDEVYVGGIQIIPIFPQDPHIV